MATLTINIPDANASRIIGDICTFWNYQATLTDMTGNTIPNPETQNQFARRMVLETMKGWVATVEGNAAGAAASAAAIAAANQLGLS